MDSNERLMEAIAAVARNAYAAGYGTDVNAYIEALHAAHPDVEWNPDDEPGQA